MGLGQEEGSDSSGEGAEKSHSGSDLMVAPRGYADGLDTARERKKHQDNTVHF